MLLLTVVQLTFLHFIDSWFHSNISGRQAQQLLLKHGSDGSFLIRRSEHSPNDYALTVRRDQDVHHLKIRNEGDCYDLYGGQQYSSLAQLVKNLRIQNYLVYEDNHPLVLKDPFNSEYPAKEK